MLKLILIQAKNALSFQTKTARRIEKIKALRKYIAEYHESIGANEPIEKSDFFNFSKLNYAF